MTKKIKPQKPSAPIPPVKELEGPILSKRGKITIAVGVAVVALGFYLVTFTDPAGQNWASTLCPFVILGGYAVIGVGIVLPDPEPLPPSSPSSSVPPPPKP